MTKTIVGYCDPLCVLPGQAVDLMISVGQAGQCQLEVVRLICGDLSTKGPGFSEEVLARPDNPTGGWPSTFEGRHQPITPGSSVEIDPAPWLDGLRSFTLQLLVYPTRPGVGRQVLARLAGFELALADGQAVPVLRVGLDGSPRPNGPAGPAAPFGEVATEVALTARRWWRLTASFDAVSGRLSLYQEPLPTRSPSDALLQRRASAATVVEALVGAGVGGGALTFAASFDGRLETPMLFDQAVDPATGSIPPGAAFARWDFSLGIGTTTVHDVGRYLLHGRTRQGPDRAVTGSRWDGTVQRWSDAPDHYGAIHFHRDDLTDAQWQPDLRWAVPQDLASGVYAFRVTGPDGDVDRTPFVVSPGPGQARARLALLLPTATYYAYANHRMTISGAEFFPSRNRLRPEFEYIRSHPEVGYSMYEYHDDASGVMQSSRRRPILNLKPGADGWAFSADTNLIAYLTQRGEAFDIITDDELHHQGQALLDHYAVVLTGSHPEYLSTAMHDAWQGWLAGGGRLLYLGGNGFYWRVAWSTEEPWVMEVRRAEDGTRGWIAEAGEYYHAFGGEYGGLWRRLGRAPNQLVGVGFAAQGFDRASAYRRNPQSIEGRAAWVFEGVDNEVFGDFGVGGGAAGQEIDRYDARLGSPAHAVVLATSFDHSDEMLRTKEEFLATANLSEDPNIRSDVVFFEGPAGGAVFSVGSIAWYGALAHNGYDNDIARITDNVVRRFLDPAPF